MKNSNGCNFYTLHLNGYNFYTLHLNEWGVHLNMGGVHLTLARSTLFFLANYVLNKLSAGIPPVIIACESCDSGATKQCRLSHVCM